jgi:choline dehydrogenase
MLSGIGPADHLEEHGIDVRVDLPGVGRNMQDHLRYSVAYESPEPLDIGWIEETQRYDRVLVGAFETAEDDRPAPDIQYGIGPGISPERPPEEGYSVTTLPVRPSSTGRLTLRSADPYDDPILDFQYLSTEKDRADAVTSVRKARRIGESEVLDEYSEREVMPGPDVQSDEEILDWVRDTAVTGYHPSCTCKMGPRDDDSVVDPELRVYGVDGLRVIDASVMPRVTSGNTNAPTWVIGEKGAEIVRAAR